MKKVLLTAAVLLSSVVASAQQKIGSFTIQPKVGMNIANVTDAENADPRIGLACGVEGEYQVSNKFSISADVIYSMQGAKKNYLFNFNYQGSTYYASAVMVMKMDYINIPILANVYVAKGFAIKLGIQPGFNINAKAEAKNITISGIKNVGATYSQDIDNIKEFDFAFPVGFSYEYKNFVLDARYNWGITKVMDDTNSKNSVFQITLGYKIPIK